MEQRQAIVSIRASKRSCLFMVYDQKSKRVLATKKVPVVRNRPIIERVHELYVVLEHYLGRFNPEAVVINDLPKVWNLKSKTHGYSVAYTIGALSSLARSWDVPVKFCSLRKARRFVRTFAKALMFESLADSEEKEVLSLCLAVMPGSFSSPVRSSA